MQQKGIVTLGNVNVGKPDLHMVLTLFAGLFKLSIRVPFVSPANLNTLLKNISRDVGQSIS